MRLRAAFIGAAFAVGYLGCWFLLLLAAPPMPWLLPASGQWVFSARPDGVAADYYGRVLYSLLAGGACALGGRFLPSREKWVPMWIAWVAGLLALALAVTAVGLWGRAPLPAPLPPGYLPR